MMFGFFDNEAELTKRGRQVTWFLVGIYVFVLIRLCWAPQPFKIEGIDTPNIIYLGRLVFLLVPFNSLLSLNQLDSFQKLFWVFGQNVTNVFLIFPLILGLLALFPQLRNLKKVLLLSFAISLSIETGQLILDLLIDANRVFEIDDLWTNTLGGALAYLAYRAVTRRFKSLD